MHSPLVPIMTTTTLGCFEAGTSPFCNRHSSCSALSPAAAQVTQSQIWAAVGLATQHMTLIAATADRSRHGKGSEAEPVLWRGLLAAVGADTSATARKLCSTCNAQGVALVGLALEILRPHLLHVLEGPPR